MKLKYFWFFLIFIFFIPSLIFAEEAILLSDAELDNISAAGFEIDINQISAWRSAIISQSNLGIISGNSIKDSFITNLNCAKINNLGSSASALQSNIAAIIAEKGDIKNIDILNTNLANIFNNAVAQGEVQATNLDLAGSSQTTLNQAEVIGSTLASQSNIAVVTALQGKITDSKINNLNVAGLTNMGNSASAVQSNIGIVVAKGDIQNTQVVNTNIANVHNIVNPLTSGGINLKNFIWQGSLGNFNINQIVVSYSAVASQRNLGLLISLQGNIKNSWVSNSNSATVSNH